MKIKIITDSTCYFNESDLAKYDITKVDLQVTLGDKAYKESELKNTDVMDAFSKGLKVLSAQPAPALFAETYQKYAKDYDYIIVFTLPKTLSGTYQSATMAIDLAEVENVRVFPVNKCAFGMENFIMANYDTIQNATDIDELINTLEKRNVDGALLFKISNLMHLHNGGRLSGGKAIIGTLLKIKAVIGQHSDGSLHNDAKFRKNNQVIDYMLEKLHELAKGHKNIYIRLININEDELHQELMTKVKAEFKEAVITETTILGPVFTVHLGDQGFGICMTFAD